MKEEQGLVQRAQKGDLSAFRELVERYKKKMYYLAFDLTGSHHDAEDLSQDVFIKAYHGIHQFRGEAKFESWLYRIMVNTCISQKRKKSLASMHLDDELDQKEKDSQFHSDHFSTNPEQSTCVNAYGFIKS